MTFPFISGSQFALKNLTIDLSLLLWQRGVQKLYEELMKSLIFIYLKDFMLIF